MDKRPRGRPRPPETIVRDQMILAVLTQRGPQTRNALAELLDLDRVRVYLALARLRRQGLVTIQGRTGGPHAVWELVDGS